MEEKINELKDMLLVFFNNPNCRGKKYRYREIKKEMCSKRGFKPDMLVMALDELQTEGHIYLDARKELYRSFPHELGFVQGEISLNKHGEGFITTESKKYKVRPNDLKDSLDGDIVILRPTNKIEHGHIIAKVDKIIKRKDGLVIVEVGCKDGEMILKPFNVKLDHPIIINGMAMKPLVEGDRLLVKIDKLFSGKYYAGVIKSLGHKDDPDADLKLIAVENNITIDFTDEALREAQALPTVVRPEDKKNRLDLTKKLIFTIDGEKTKDRDDAISLEINEKGNYVLGVHISDVTHYIHPGMQLWDEAISRGTSVYMVNTVIPQFPHIISNGICSLNPNVERLCLSCIMEISPEGKILNYDFEDTVIDSRKAMTYEDVNKLLEEGEFVEGYEEFYDNLVLMQGLSKKLDAEKKRRGYVDFGNNDIEIEVDENGNPLEFRQRVQRTAEGIIENFMLLAGECYANYMILPSPLRVHEKPDEEDVEEAFNLLGRSGLKVKTSHDVVNGKVIQQILAQFKNAEERNVVANIMLRSMKLAKYDVQNLGHFGLGLPKYGHFTSPIRRAADLLAHHNLKQQRDNRFNIKLVDAAYDDMEKICRHITKKERNADQAERDANHFEMIRYMSEHIGEKFEATVTYVNSRGIYIKTSDGIDGKILAEDLEGDKFFYDDATASYRGKKSKIKIRIGTRLTLTAIDTKKEYRTVNFGLDEEDFMKLVMKKRGA